MVSIVRWSSPVCLAGPPRSYLSIGFTRGLLASMVSRCKVQIHQAIGIVRWSHPAHRAGPPRSELSIGIQVVVLTCQRTQCEVQTHPLMRYAGLWVMSIVRWGCPACNAGSPRSKLSVGARATLWNRARREVLLIRLGPSW